MRVWVRMWRLRPDNVGTQRQLPAVPLTIAAVRSCGGQMLSSELGGQLHSSVPSIAAQLSNLLESLMRRISPA